MAYIVRRLLLYIPVALLVFTIVFWFIRFVPGDFVDILLENATSARDESVQAAIRQDLGLDVPHAKQYFITLGSYLRGDLGNSILDGSPILNEVLRRVPITLEVAGLAIIFALIIAIPAGVISAIWQDTLMDYAARVFAIVALAVPNFWLATLLVVYPANLWQYAGPVGYPGLFDDPLRNLEKILPAAIVSGSISAGILARFIRSSLLEVLRQDYIRTARAKGLSEWSVIFVHAMKNAMGSTITVGGLIFANLITAAIVIEGIFSIPGLGLLVINSIELRDYTTLQAVAIFFAFAVVLLNLLIDIAVAWLDPRARTI